MRKRIQGYCWFCAKMRAVSMIWHTAKDGSGGYVGMHVPACRECRGCDNG
jgi:hypothetical protein